MAKRKYVRRGAYRMTSARRVALRKAQMASARKRKRNTKIRNVALVGAGVTAIAGAAVARHKLSGSTFSRKTYPNASIVTGQPQAPHIRFTAGGGEVAMSIIRRSNPSKRTRYAYTHKSLIPALKAKTVAGHRTRSYVDKDAIPLYNPKNKSRSWPHVPEKIARKTNRRLREQGLLA